MKVSLRRPTRKINLNKVFLKAVRGHKKLQKKSKSQIPVEVSKMEIKSLENVSGGPGPGMGGGAPSFISKMEVGAIERKIPIRPAIVDKSIRGAMGEGEIDIKTINIIYTLIPSQTKIPFASANIKWYRRESSLFYEPDF